MCVSKCDWFLFKFCLDENGVWFINFIIKCRNVSLIKVKVNCVWYLRWNLFYYRYYLKNWMFERLKVLVLKNSDWIVFWL